MAAKRIKGTKITKERAAARSKPKSKSAKLSPTEKPIRAGQPKLSRPTKVDQKDQNAKKEAKKKVGLSLNWKRAIHINKMIDDVLFKELTPVILQMKQESSEPITVGIDSTGGSLAAVEALLGLLRSPDQDGNSTPVYTASTNKAYSAAASLLAFGDYSVAFPYSRILYHDVRYSGIEDVTPSKALQTARELERGNTAFSLRLAGHIRSRLIWVYIDLRRNFAEVRKQYTSFAKPFDDAFQGVFTKENDRAVDVVGFSLALYRRLTAPADNEIAIRALHLLNSWMQIERIEQRLSKTVPEGEKSVDLVRSIDDLVKEVRRMETTPEKSTSTPEPESDRGLDENARKDIKLLIEVLARRYAADKNLRMGEDGLDIITEDFSFINDINSSQHLRTITQLMIDHDRIFFGRSIAKELQEAKSDTERSEILAPVYPQARMLWYYMVLICRCLCQGDHLLTPGDAQLLGLVDEVLGGGPVESRREWRKANPDYEQFVSP